MMLTFLRATKPYAAFSGRTPSILELQDTIENGWRQGINSIAKEETGGVWGTRKYIGTSEAQTVFTVLGYKPIAHYFPPSITGSTQTSLLEFVERYYTVPTMRESKVTVSPKSPMYFQHAGHSMTIVGFERGKDGEDGLLVFDPYWETPGRVRRWTRGEKVGQGGRGEVERCLGLYRRGREYLEKYREFEIIVWVISFPVWGVGLMGGRMDEEGDF